MGKERSRGQEVLSSNVCLFVAVVPKTCLKCSLKQNIFKKIF